MNSKHRNRLPRRLGIVVAIALMACLPFFMDGCAATHPRRSPLGETFPSVVGKDLHEEPVRLPEDFNGAPLLLLVGYEQNTQFDLDRWLLGLTQAEVIPGVAVREVPTIPGLMPGMFSGYIDSGMRSGIPREDWAAVVTVYRDAEAIAKFTGNAEPGPGRIVLLDGEGRVVFFHDEGYSVGTLTRLQAALEELEGGG